ncbi:DUF2628 domain-containing protein [Shinella sp. CPCC 101442]|uniref:DUF2628 domain-containing protein n=1 Tax=Shinella sp. CPCC 101442 TaxID=2932265 RepID=UPI002152C8B7|nr:DUF2628 domain-containing protein [Shinella sp. CPCC 101442]MCR6501530.1 DUF2628 domain-containing protein [Shinella sp. CPCC 101442]
MSGIDLDSQKMDVAVSTAEPPLRIKGLLLDDVLTSFLQRNVDYYAPVFTDMERNGIKFHANLAALLLTPFWLMYRRFYVSLLVFYSAPILAVLTGSLFTLIITAPWPIPQLILLGPFSASVLFCSFGNYFLYRRFRRLISDVSIPPEKMLQIINKKGGGSKIVLAVAIVTFGMLFLALPLLIIISAILNPPGSLN